MVKEPPPVPGVATPTFPEEPATAETVSVSPSGSESLPRTPGAMAVRIVFSSVEPVSATAVGPSFTAVTLIVSVDVSHPPFPSVTT